MTHEKFIAWVCCDWKEDINGIWQTQCGNSFMLETGTPEENEFEFCCYCGKRIADIFKKERELK